MLTAFHYLTSLLLDITFRSNYLGDNIAFFLFTHDFDDTGLVGWYGCSYIFVY